MGTQATKVRGKILEIDQPTPVERDWIFDALQRPEVHVPLSLREGPSRAAFDAGSLELHRGDATQQETVRYTILRRRDDGRAVGFFLDFGWDFPTDPTREIDLAFPDARDRGVGSYLDATVIVAQYLFRNGLAKRLRWRVEAPRDGSQRRSVRQGARLLLEQQDRHPVTGEWVDKLVYEYAVADMQLLGEKLGIDPAADYADQEVSVFAAYRRDGAD